MSANDKSAPQEIETGKQLDDNIDDLGRKPDGTKLDQPGTTKPSKSPERPDPPTPAI